MLLAAEAPRDELATTLREQIRRPECMAGAAFALASLGDREAVPYLMHMIRYGLDPAAGYLGLGRLKATETVVALRRTSRPMQPREGAAAAWALGEAGGEAAEALLLELLDHAL